MNRILLVLLLFVGFATYAQVDETRRQEKGESLILYKGFTGKSTQANFQHVINDEDLTLLKAKLFGFHQIYKLEINENRLGLKMYYTSDLDIDSTVEVFTYVSIGNVSFLQSETIEPQKL